jgi:hypothetical protein
MQPFDTATVTPSFTTWSAPGLLEVSEPLSTLASNVMVVSAIAMLAMNIHIVRKVNNFFIVFDVFIGLIYNGLQYCTLSNRQRYEIVPNFKDIILSFFSKTFHFNT